VGRERASRGEPKPLRLFIAFEIDAAAKEGIEASISPFRQQLTTARWSPPANWHVTLRFLGGTLPSLVDKVTQTCEEAASIAAAFETSVTGFGGFPSAAKARVLWAGLDDPGGRASALVGMLDEALKPDFPAEKRAYHAHVTVARSEPPVAVPEELRLVGPIGPKFAVERIVLFRSHLRRPAPEYEPLETFLLGG
jgi:RNA 2',3'-cyclic 3'-phosphodiesterase